MGVYDAECGKCGKQEEYIRPFSECLDTPECCGKKMNKVILSGPMVSAMTWTDHKGFYVGQRYIGSGDEYKRYMKEKNLLSGKEGSEEADYQKKTKEKQRVKKRREAVERVVREHVK